jgi:HlyD family secretion protein
MQRRRRLFLALGFGLVLTAIVAVSLWRTPDRESDRYSWDTVSRGDIREPLVASGEIQARTRVNVGTSVMGEIKALHVKDGQNVEAGDLLVTIDQERLRQERSRAEALLEGQRKDAARQEAAMRKSQETFRRFDELFRQGLISEEDHRQAALNRESAELGFAVARTIVQQGQANLAAMRDALSKSVLRAPFAGRVTGLKAEKGETAIPGTSNLPGAVLMVISDMSELMAEIKANESEVVRLRPGQLAQVTAESFPGRVFPGKVYEVASAAERIGQDANLYRVKVALDMTAADVDRLRPGMSARAVVLTSEVKGGLRVPLQAVLEREGSLEDAQKKGLLSPESRSVAFVLENGRARERPVTTGIANTQYYEVKEGLKEAERVLTGPIRKLKGLKDDSAVKVKKKSDAEAEEEARRRKDRKP